MEIEWRDIPIAPGYMANSLGEIWSKDRSVKKTIKGVERAFMLKGKKLKPWMANAYQYCQAGAGVKTSVHRLVCMAFHGLPEGKQEASHLDGNPKNNAPSNLAWASHSENEQHKKLHGTYARPKNFKKPWHKKRGTKQTKHPMADVISKMVDGGASVADVALFLNISKSGAYHVIKNRLKGDNE